MSENVFIVVQALGGLGLFLLGMIIMTEGLSELAGDAIRAALMRFTSSPTSNRRDWPVVNKSNRLEEEGADDVCTRIILSLPHSAPFP